MTTSRGHGFKVASRLKAVARLGVPRRMRERARDALWALLAPQWPLPSGLIIEVGSDEEFYLYTDLLVSGEYDQSIDLVIDNANSPPLVVDLGANVGYFALRFADRWMRRRGPDAPFQIVCVEGSPATYQELRRRVSQPLLLQRCAAHHGLVGRRSGAAVMQTAAPTAQHSIMGATQAGGQAVPFLDLESVLPARRRVNLLKCDIEGAEELFLESYSGLLGRIDVAVFEFHRELCDVGRCMRLIEEAGLRPWTGPEDALHTAHLHIYRHATPASTGRPEFPDPDERDNGVAATYDDAVP